MAFQMRRRIISPGSAFDEEIHPLGDRTWRLFVTLPMIADREGRLEDRPQRIKAQLFPFHEEMTGDDVDAMLAGLESVGKIVRYEVAGHRFIAFTAWRPHQSPHGKEPESTILPPPVEPASQSGKTMPAPSISQASSKPDQTSPPNTDTGPDTDTNTECVTNTLGEESDFVAEVEKLWAAWPHHRRPLDQMRLGNLIERVSGDRPRLDVARHMNAALADDVDSTDWLEGIIPALDKWVEQRKWDREVSRLADPFWKREPTPHLREVQTGVPLTPEQREAFDATWAELTGDKSAGVWLDQLEFSVDDGELRVGGSERALAWYRARYTKAGQRVLDTILGDEVDARSAA